MVLISLGPPRIQPVKMILSDKGYCVKGDIRILDPIVSIRLRLCKNFPTASLATR